MNASIVIRIRRRWRRGSASRDPDAFAPL